MGNSRNLANLLGTGSTIATAKIADDAITSDKLADDSVVAAAIATNAVVADGLSSSAIAAGDLPTGSVIQVTQGTIFTGNYSENTGAWTATALEVSITPISSSNKIMVNFSGAIRCYNTSNHNAMGAWRIYRKIGSGSYGQLNTHEMSHRVYDYGGSGIINDVPFNIQYLDSPSTTSTVYYQLYGHKMAGSQIELNPDGQDESYAFAMEVAG